MVSKILPHRLTDIEYLGKLTRVPIDVFVLKQAILRSCRPHSCNGKQVLYYVQAASLNSHNPLFPLQSDR